MSAKKKTERWCFLPGYTTGHGAHEKGISLFRAPAEPTALEKRKRAIPRKDKELQPHSAAFDNGGILYPSKELLSLMSELENIVHEILQPF